MVHVAGTAKVQSPRRGAGTPRLLAADRRFRTVKVVERGREWTVRADGKRRGIILFCRQETTRPTSVPENVPADGAQTEAVVRGWRGNERQKQAGGRRAIGDVAIARESHPKVGERLPDTVWANRRGVGSVIVSHDISRHFAQ